MLELPEEFIARTKPLLGDEWNDFAKALQETPPTSIRINPEKMILNESEGLEKVKWCDTGYYLPVRPQFTFDPLLHAGVYYVQEASSMFVEYALKQFIKGKVKCLDLCAAPGGKSTIISSCISKDSLLISNEIIRSRAHILSENLMKWGNGNCVVTNNKSEDFSALDNYFDLILVDAPCSGEGMFRKDHQAIEEWSVNNVKVCAERQKNIISSIWESLKPGGYLFYSTCTYNREENEEIVSWICDNYDADIVDLPINPEWGVVCSEVNGHNTFHFYPHRTKGEGLFFAVLQKRGEEKAKPTRRGKRDKKRPNNLAEYAGYLNSKEEYFIGEEDGCVYAFLKEYMDDLWSLNRQLNIVSRGINIGEVKGKNFIPHQALALSNNLNQESFVREDVDWKSSIAYLRKEVLHLEDSSKDYLLLTYKNKPLGFVKNLGNRANNLYPNEWRIRSSNLPLEEIEVL